MSADGTAALHDLVLELLAEVKGIRGDLKRREERHLKATGAIPASSGGGSRAPSSGGAVFPNYGTSKGQPVHGASVRDLNYYADGCRRTLGDSNKSRWHEKERILLAAIESEIARQSGGGQGAPSFGEPPPDSFGSPPPDDEDIPFLRCA
jgi:hypothetical protein